MTFQGSAAFQDRGTKTPLNSAFIGIQMWLGAVEDKALSVPVKLLKAFPPFPIFFNRQLNVDNEFHYLFIDLLQFPLISDAAQSSLIWLCVYTKPRNLIMFVKVL